LKDNSEAKMSASIDPSTLTQHSTGEVLSSKSSSKNVTKTSKEWIVSNHFIKSGWLRCDDEHQCY